MLPIKYINENFEHVMSCSEKKGSKVNLESTIELDQTRKTLVGKADDMKAERNRFSKQIGLLKQQGDDITDSLIGMKKISNEIKSIDDQIREIEEKLHNELLYVPNVFHDSVPIGNSESDNQIIKEWGKAKEFNFSPMDHIEIGEAQKLFDFKRAVRMSGSGFPLYTGAGARLERGLIQFMLDLHTENHGYLELFPPFLTSRAATQTTGQLPKFEEDMYHIPGDDLFCISTAEVPVTNIHRDEILEEDRLPYCYTAYSACFRREAGSYGKDTRGLLRVHQFNKVELVRFAHPDQSYAELEVLLGHAEKVLQLLDIPYRIVALCSGDLSFAAAKCYDIEIWAPGTNRWLEVSSCSNFESFQARRGNIRFRRGDTGKLDYVHTLNGSGVATPRLMASLLENNQQKDGSVLIPEPLQDYVKFKKLEIS